MELASSRIPSNKTRIETLVKGEGNRDKFDFQNTIQQNKD
jgi:hypothetical protein